MSRTARDYSADYPLQSNPEQQPDPYLPRPSSIHDRVQLGQGTTFLPGPKDASISHLISHVLEHGYAILPSIFTSKQISLANAELARLSAQHSSGPASQGGRNPFEGFNTKRIYALCDKSRAFDPFPIHETVLKLNDYFLQKAYLMTSYHTVVIGPGEREQEMHTDDGLVGLPRPRPLMGIGTMVALDDFTSTNGATSLIPGSHLWDDTRRPTREEMIPAIMPAGSMVYFLNTLWHSGGANTSDKPRRSLTVQYCQPWLRTYENFTVAQGWENLDVVPKKLLQLMGFSTHEFMGYVDGRSPRAGVEMRKRRLVEWALGERDKGKGKEDKEGEAKSKI
ncbi:phytanoyl-CoA-dioxygenase-like protein [Leptodontidium sp. 2 PMI_412]|nr:phytanoyl-CoA-dioxygenase-like protein [Leptodontidium sp. 2 PMI_412]